MYMVILCKNKVKIRFNYTIATNKLLIYYRLLMNLINVIIIILLFLQLSILNEDWKYIIIL